MHLDCLKRITNIRNIFYKHFKWICIQQVLFGLLYEKVLNELWNGVASSAKPGERSSEINSIYTSQFINKFIYTFFKNINDREKQTNLM